jgi:hypothetical protein
MDRFNAALIERRMMRRSIFGEDGSPSTRTKAPHRLCRQLKWVLTSIFVGAGLPVGAEEGATSDERHEADCVDIYNDPKYVEPSEKGFVSNPFLVRGLVGVKPVKATHDEVGTPRATAVGATVDFSSPVLLSQFLRSSSTDLGLVVGGLGTFWSASGDSREFEGELRLGLALRRFQPIWSAPPHVGPVGIAPRCRRTRTDINIDLLRWRVGGFTDLTASGHPTVLSSSIGLPSGTARFGYSTWAMALGGSLLEFRVAPDFQLRTRVRVDYDVMFIASRLEVQVIWRRGWPSVAAAILLGFNLELGGG